MTYSYQYPRPALTVDAAILRTYKGRQQILLIERKNEPFRNKWALPGGFLDMEETLEEAVLRELEEETGLKNIKVDQFRTFDKIDRDPRGRTISVVFTGRLLENQNVAAGDDAKNAAWFFLDSLPELAFDHTDILNLIIKEINLLKGMSN